jgi:hypothetical protein
VTLLFAAGVAGFGVALAALGTLVFAAGFAGRNAGAGGQSGDGGEGKERENRFHDGLLFLF